MAESIKRKVQLAFESVGIKATTEDVRRMGVELKKVGGGAAGGGGGGIGGLLFGKEGAGLAKLAGALFAAERVGRMMRMGGEGLKELATREITAGDLVKKILDPIPILGAIDEVVEGLQAFTNQSDTIAKNLHARMAKMSDDVREMKLKNEIALLKPDDPKRKTLEAELRHFQASDPIEELIKKRSGLDDELYKFQSKADIAGRREELKAREEEAALTNKFVAAALQGGIDQDREQLRKDEEEVRLRKQEIKLLSEQIAGAQKLRDTVRDEEISSATRKKSRDFGDPRLISSSRLTGVIGATDPNGPLLNELKEMRRLQARHLAVLEEMRTRNFTFSDRRPSRW